MPYMPYMPCLSKDSDCTCMSILYSVSHRIHNKDGGVHQWYMSSGHVLQPKRSNQSE